MPDCSLHRTSALQDLQILVGAQQCSAALELWQIVAYTAHLPSKTCRSWQELNRAQHRWSYGRLFLTPHICHPETCRSWQELNRAQQRWSYGRIVPYTTNLPSRTCKSWRELNSGSAPLELWQIVPCTTDLPSRTCRSWQELSSAQQCWSCGRLLLTPAHLPSKTCRSWQELNSGQHRWSCGRLFLTPHICHPGPAGLGRSSEMLGGARAMGECSPHHKSAIQDLQVLDGAQQRSTVLELWQILPPTAHLPCKDLQVLAGAQQRWIVANYLPHRKTAIQDV